MAQPERIELRPKEARAIAALLCEPSVEAAARSARIGARTLRRWLQRPDFAEELARAAREAMAGAMKTLQAASVEAVETLRAVLADEEGPTTARVSAARVVLEQAQRAAEREELEARIVDLERAVEERGLAEDSRWG
jgi:hypothetical protein